MANFFVDPVGGSDANDGTTFANRKRSLNSVTAAALAPGDTIRYIASPDPTLVGNATWTDASRVLTLAAACTQTIDNGETAWTASANVTATANATRKQGSFSAQLVVATAFATGKVAYRALPSTLNLSGYQQVSLWFKDSTANVAGSLELRLCTDATGDVGVHTIPLTEAVPVAGGWRVVVKDFGSNLSAAIASIAVYAISDPGAVTLNLDNIIACKASSANDSLTHLSLIGKNTVGEPEWYPILNIDGTALELGGANDISLAAAPTTPRPYSGTTETVSTYKLQPLDGVNGRGSAPSFSTANIALTDSGSAGNPITISGGWNRTDMSTQSGNTWLTGSHWATAPLGLSAKTNITVAQIGAAHFTTAPVTGSGTTGPLDIALVGAVGCIAAWSADCQYGLRLDLGNVVACSSGALLSAVNSGDVQLAARRIANTHGNSTGYGVRFGGGAGLRQIARVDRIDNTALNGVLCISSNGTYELYNCTLEDNASADTLALTAGDRFRLINCSLLSTQPYSSSSGNPGDTITLHGFNGDANDHRRINRYWTVMSEATVRHTASGISWKLSPLDAVVVNSLYPVEQPLARIAVASGSLVTLSAWARRDNTGLTAGIKVRGGTLAGITTDVTDEVTVAADTWEQLTITFTPTAAGVVELVAYAYGGATYNGYFDDLTIGQA